MLRAILNRLHETADLQSFFYTGELVVFCVFAGLIWFLRPKRPESNFRVREADLAKDQKVKNARSQLAEAKIKRNEPLMLPGIRLDGEPHEVLGVSLHASPEQIQKAYRDLMKRYHPDRVGPVNSLQWREAQKIAEAINRAKDQLLKGRGRSGAGP